MTLVYNPDRIVRVEINGHPLVHVLSVFIGAETKVSVVFDSGDKAQSAVMRSIFEREKVQVDLVLNDHKKETVTYRAHERIDGGIQASPQRILKLDFSFPGVRLVP